MLDRAALEGLHLPISQARGLPNAAYTESAFLVLENERLFARTWCLAGFAHGVPQPGDSLAADVAGRTFLLIRGNDGAVAVIDEAGAAMRHAVWGGLVFVNPDGCAPPLHESFAPFFSRVAPYDFDALVHGATLNRVVAANWKLVHENFFDAYHVATVHPALESFTPTAGYEIGVEGPVVYGGTVYDAPVEGRGKGLPVMPGLDAVLLRSAAYFHVFPSVDINIYPDHVAVFHLTPLGPGRTALALHLFFTAGAVRDEAHRAARDETAAYWAQVVDEDVAVLSGVQQGRHSPGFDGGVLSPAWDVAALHFARLVAAAVAD